MTTETTTSVRARLADGRFASKAAPGVAVVERPATENPVDVPDGTKRPKKDAKKRDAKKKDAKKKDAKKAKPKSGKKSKKK